MVDMTVGEILGEDVREIRICEKHGEYESRKIFKRFMGCPQCSEEQRIAREAEEQKEREAGRKRAEEYRIQTLLQSSCIPKRFIDKRVQNYEISNEQQKMIADEVTKYTYEFDHDNGHSGRNMALIGNAGNGKTHLACAVAMYLIRTCRSARFTTVSELSRVIRESKKFDSDVTESQMIRIFTSYELLIIDEVGIQSGTDAESRALFDVFNSRYEEMKPTIFISNLDIKGLRNALGDRIMDRLKEDGGQILSFNWGSYRK